MRRWLAVLMLTLSSLSACESGTEELLRRNAARDSGATFPDAALPDSGAGGPDAAVPRDAGGPMPCPEPSPAGCTQNACPPTMVCDTTIGCKPTSCVCTPDGWSCDDSCGGGECRATDLLFRFRYESDVPADRVFVQSHGTIGQEWVQILDANRQPLSVLHDCGICGCEACGSCPVCSSSPASTQPLWSGERVEWLWDTALRPRRRCGTAPGSTLVCEDVEPLRPGRYFARFCASYQVRQDPDGSRVVDPRCVDIQFDWPEVGLSGGVVEHARCDCG